MRFGPVGSLGASWAAVDRLQANNGNDPEPSLNKRRLIFL